jgi:hypothetical protein
MPDEPADYSTSGWRSTGRKRVVCGWFLTRVEEFWQHENGAAEWRRYCGTFLIKSLDGRA